jgi:stage III sporulation protein AD
MEILSIAALCLVVTVICKLFDSQKDIAIYIKIAAAALVLGGVIIYVSPIADTINTIFDKAGASDTYINILFKALGICYITQFASDICKDSGEGALAVQIEIAGKITLLLLSLPLFEALTDLVTVLLGI